MQNNQILIYSMDLDEQDTDHKDCLSTSSQTYSSKTPNTEPELLNAQTIDTLPPTEIIRVAPNPHSQLFDLNQNQPQNNFDTIHEGKKTIDSKNSQTDQQSNQDEMNSEENSSQKTKKSRRKRMESPLKRRNQLEQKITDYEPPQEQQNFTDKISQNSNDSSQNERQEIKQKKWKFQTIGKHESDLNQRELKLQNYFQMQDSERNFQFRKQEMPPKPQRKFIKKKKTRNVESSLELSDRQKVEDIPSCQVLIDDPSVDSEEYISSQDEQIYENYSLTEEDEESAFKKKNIQSSPSLKMKIIKQLPKQVLVKTTLESLIMNPVPQNMKIKCRFSVETKYFGMSKQFNLVLEQTGQTVLSAKKQRFSFTGSSFIISLNKDFISKRKENQFWTGKLEGNFSGNNYQLSQRNASSSVTFSKGHSIEKSLQKETEETESFDKYEEALSAIISFENNLWGFSGIRNMEIMKLDHSKLTPRDIAKKVTLEDILQRNQLSKTIKIETTKPSYNKETRRYNLNFEKKAKIPSAKNTILHWKVPLQQTPQKSVIEQPKTIPKLKNSFSMMGFTNSNQVPSLQSASIKQTFTNLAENKKTNVVKNIKIQCLLIGKQTEKQYLVEVGHPLSIFQAFGACLANEDTKYMVN